MRCCWRTTICPLEHIRHQEGFIGMMHSRNWKLELVRELNVGQKGRRNLHTSRAIPGLSHLCPPVHNSVHESVGNKLRSYILGARMWHTLTRPRRTSTRASHCRSSGYSPRPSQRSAATWSQKVSCFSLIFFAVSYLSRCQRRQKI